MALSRARRERSIDYWPGFVDALSTLILGIVRSTPFQMTRTQ